MEITSASHNDILVFSTSSNRFENKSDDLVLSGSFSGSYSGIYFGDGSNLENVNAAAAPLISSGSATASVASGDTFVVTAPKSGSQFTGSITTSGSIIVGGGGRFAGDGSGLTDINIANLALTLNTLESGSYTASISETGEFKVFDSGITGSVLTSLSGSVNISESLNVGGVITGDGSGITNIDIANLAIDSSKIFTGSVTASVDPLGFFRVENLDPSVNSGSVKIEFSGSLHVSQSITASLYRGDGGGLYNIPLDALEDLQLDRIISGSTTASVSPNKGFVVNNQISGTLFVGDGGGLFNIPAESLEDLNLPLIISGGISASVHDTEGFRVYSPTSGSTFIGNVTIPSGSGFFSGSGAGLFDIPADAIVDLDQSRILSGSVTASVTPDDGFVVRSIDSGSTFFGEVNFENDVTASRIKITDEIFSPRITSSFVGSYQG